jgi:hypothetical protein
MPLIQPKYLQVHNIHTHIFKILKAVVMRPKHHLHAAHANKHGTTRLRCRGALQAPFSKGALLRRYDNHKVQIFSQKQLISDDDALEALFQKANGRCIMPCERTPSEVISPGPAPVIMGVVVAATC